MAARAGNVDWNVPPGKCGKRRSGKTSDTHTMSADYETQGRRIQSPVGTRNVPRFSG